MIGEATDDRPASTTHAERATAGLLAILHGAATADRMVLSETRAFYAGSDPGDFALAFDICWPCGIDEAELHLLPRVGLADVPVRRLSMAGAGMAVTFDGFSFEKRHLARQIELVQAITAGIHAHLATGHTDATPDDQAFLVRQSCRASLLAQGFSKGLLCAAPTFHGLERLLDDFGAWAARSVCLTDAEVLALVALRRRSGRLSSLLGRTSR